MIFGHLNINSIQNKFGEISDILCKNLLDIFALTESKLDSSFPDSQFMLNDFNLYRADRSHNGGGVMCYVRSSIPHRPRPDIAVCKENIESIVIDVHNKSYRCFLIFVYRSPSTSCNILCDVLATILEKSLKECNTIYLIGDLNVNFLKRKHELTDLLGTYGLTNIIKQATCYKSVSNPSSIDVIISNRPKTIARHLNTNIGISDFHNFTCAATKIQAPAIAKNKISYRSFKHFNEDIFLCDVNSIPFEMSNSSSVDEKLSTYISHLNVIIDKHAPLKTRYIKNNQVPYMNDKLRKAINVKGMMYRKYLKNSNEQTLEAYRHQRNLVTRLKKQSIKQYFDIKCEKSDRNSKSFWETIKPFFSNKSPNSCSKINLLENDRVETDPETICNIFNDFFVDVASKIAPQDVISQSYNDHESIKAIKETYTIDQTFNFKPVSQRDVYKKLKNLNPKKATGYDQIPPKLIKLAAYPISRHITPIINTCFSISCFPEPLKFANVSPVFKKSDNLKKENFRPISVLTTLSKIFESITADQMNEHFKDILCNWLSAYRALYSSNNVLLNFVEFLRKSLDENKHVGCILMDLSKAFDSLNHDLLLAKLEAYGVSQSACIYLKSYLSHRKQRVKIQDQYSSWNELKLGVPQGSILGPLLFNIFINDIFLCIDKNVNLYNYADDNTLVFSHKDHHIMQSTLENASMQAIHWFEINRMQANPTKFQSLYLSKNPDEHVQFHIQNSVLKPENTVTLLGVHFDNKLAFDYHISHVCKKAAKQVNALRRLAHVLSPSSKLKIFNSFIQSNFNYCPVVYNTFTKHNVRILEKLHERALRFVLNDFSSTYSEVLMKTRKPSLALSRLRTIAEQVYKVKHDLAPPFSSSFFQKHETLYDLRRSDILHLPKYNTVKYGKHSFQYMGAFIWNALPNDIKLAYTILDFKTKIKHWQGPECNCRNCLWCDVKL